ncbi:MAG: hypothetical protein LC114_10195 [Bryobacterales bacterium]|nr:hypothetical protein [Bryobacterales bacterium]
MKMNRIATFLSILFVMLALTVPEMVFAVGSDDIDPLIPSCINMVDAQIPGEVPGSACQVFIALENQAGTEMLGSIYRSGWTSYYTSESDSDLTEDHIKVQAYLYWWLNDHWSLLDSCVEDNYWASHAACRTYGGASQQRQKGYHYFQKAGYQDESFSTQHTWSS